MCGGGRDLSSPEKSAIRVCDYWLNAAERCAVYSLHYLDVIHQLFLHAALGQSALVFCRCRREYELSWCRHDGIYGRFSGQYWC
ncbi:Uncharacterised protein [Vibrio cholerae]|nr:Uncharacterised protein [Vibrio cholerae]